jgi:hypothetical protein
MMTFPPLYECSECGQPVRVIPRPGGNPLIERACSHDEAVIWANRKVTLRGKGALESMNPLQRGVIHLKITLRQFLSALTGRSV